MIQEYLRPTTLEEALALLRRQTPVTRPMGGGTWLSRTQEPVTVVDLQALGMDTIDAAGNLVRLGAGLRLQQMVEADALPAALRRAAGQEAHLQLRNMATLGGTLVSAGARSLVLPLLLALDARLTWEPDSRDVPLGDWLPLRRQQSPGLLITAVQIPGSARCALHWVARTPADWPLIAVAMARWPSGRTRLVVNGVGPAPVLAMDGPQGGGEATAAVSAAAGWADEWASAEYRREMASVLAARCAGELEA